MNVAWRSIWVAEHGKTNSGSGSSKNATGVTMCVAGRWESWRERWKPIKGDVMIMDELGSGRSGIVCRCLFNGQVYAIKLCLLLSPSKILEELDNETKVAIQDKVNASAKQEAIGILKHMQELGVTHGDARVENILFQRDEGNILRPRIIDLAFGKMDATKDELETDMRKWKEVLGC